MSLERFLELLDACGPDLARWPGPERPAAEALLVGSAVARRRLRQAERIEAVLRRPVPPASRRLAEAVASIPLRHPRVAAAAVSLRRWLTPGLAALTAAAAAGFVIGVISEPVVSEPPVDVAGLVYGAVGAGQVEQ